MSTPLYNAEPSDEECAAMEVDEFVRIREWNRRRIVNGNYNLSEFNARVFIDNLNWVMGFAWRLWKLLEQSKDRAYIRELRQENRELVQRIKRLEGGQIDSQRVRRLQADKEALVRLCHQWQIKIPERLTADFDG